MRTETKPNPRPNPEQQRRLTPKHPRPFADEMYFKEWVMREAARRGVTESAIHKAYYRGLYPKLRVRAVNSRVLFVIALAKPSLNA